MTQEEFVADPSAFMQDEGLFDMAAPPPVGLADRFGVPPFSVLDRRTGHWQERRRRWLMLGIRSELGRAGGLIADEDSGYVQGMVPLSQRSDRALESAAKGSSAEARRAQAILERRAAQPEKRQLDSAPPPGGGGTGAWKGRTNDGRMASIDPKWDSKTPAFEGTPKGLIPGAGGVGGAYDRSRDQAFIGRQRRGAANPDDSSTDKTMRARPLSSGGAFMTAEERMARQRLNEAGAHADQDRLNAITGQETLSGTSIFDPVLCELAYRWFTAPGMRVLDPFAGGSVRGIVAAKLERFYLGIDLRPEQIAADVEQGRAILGDSRFMPRWVAGDSAEALLKAPPASVDFVFSCPPYADLEVYSSDPRDISNMSWDDFCRVHSEIIDKACRALKPDRFAAWVISDVRDKKGLYRGLPAEAVRAFKKAGLEHYNDAVILDPVGSAAVRAARIFLGGRKLTRMHQHLLVFVKGDAKRASQAIAAQEQVLDQEA